jgi:DNA-binding PadR family transcriptional regulator
MSGRIERTKPTPLTSLGRFSDPAVLILTSLAGGPRHGYALIKDIEEFASVTLVPGTLYGALDRLAGYGLIERLPAVDRRHPYQITAPGKAALREHIASLEQVSTTAISRLQPRGAF